MSRRTNDTGTFGAFLFLCLGHVVSVFGSSLSGFVIGVWAYQTSGSVTRFGLIAFFTIMPQVVTLAVAGALADRWNRRRVLLVSNLGAAACTAALWVLAARGNLQIWQIYLLVAASAVFTAFQYPAITASIPLLIRKRDLVRANGLSETGVALAVAAAPAAAAALLGALGLAGVLLIDLSTFGFAIVTLLSIRIPETPASGGAARAPKVSSEPAATTSLWAEARVGWSYIYDRPGLVALLLLVASSNFMLAMVQVLLTPLVLGFATTQQLGLVLSLATGGMVVGGIVVTVWGGPHSRMPAVLALSMFQGAILLLGGVRPNLLLVATAGFCFSFCMPFVMATIQAVWQSKVDLSIQGRVFAIRRVISLLSPLLAFLGAGPLADAVFDPWMAPGGRLAGTVGRWIGVGPGRGIGLLFVLLGGAMLVFFAGVSRYPPLRNLDRMPDAVTAPQVEASS